MTENIIQFAFYPFIAIIGTFFIIIKLLSDKFNNKNLNKNDFGKIITSFILFFFLVSSSSIYGLIVALNIDSLHEGLILEQNIKLNFFYLIYFSIILKGFVVYKFYNFSLDNVEKFKKYISFGILGIAIAEIPAILGLIYIFNEIAK